MSYINPRHSVKIRELFPDIAFHGVDLDNIEVKESESKTGMFTISKADLRAEFILFYHRKPHNYFYIVKVIDLPAIKEKRGIRITQIGKLAIYKTNSYKKIKNKVNRLRSKYRSQNEEIDQILSKDLEMVVEQKCQLKQN